MYKQRQYLQLLVDAKVAPVAPVALASVLLLANFYPEMLALTPRVAGDVIRGLVSPGI